MITGYLDWARSEALADSRRFYRCDRWEDAIIYKGAFALEAKGYEPDTAAWLAGITLYIARRRRQLLEFSGPGFLASWGSLVAPQRTIHDHRFQRWLEIPLGNPERFYDETMRTLRMVPDFAISSLAEIAVLRQASTTEEGRRAYLRHCSTQFNSLRFTQA